MKPLSRNISVLVWIVLCTGLLSGCMYPGYNSSAVDNRVAVREDVVLVQAAVEEYRKVTGVLPIHNSDMSTPKYEKFKIDFSRLTNGPFLSKIPDSAFESGGKHNYLIIEDGGQFLVRLMDIQVFQQVTDLETVVRQYRQANNGDVPGKTEISPGWYSIDYEKLDVDRLQVTSMFTGSLLPILISQEGELAVDYAPDIMKIIREQKVSSEEGAPAANSSTAAVSGSELAKMDDLRSLLVASHQYVPVKSQPYIWVDDQPILATDKMDQ